MLQLAEAQRFKESSVAGTEPEDGPAPPRYPRVPEQGYRHKDSIPIQDLTREMHSGSFWMRANDPSAGSPTETLLRLLLPLSDKVH